MERYSYIAKIGEGMFGSVLKATQVKTREPVAIKKMKKKFYSWKECLALREVRSLRKLHHPNIVQLKEVIREHNVLYFVFEYLYQNLYELTKKLRHKGKHLSESRLCSYMYQIFKGLAYVHKQGFFHRDMKPENILIDRTGTIVKLADFGLAREIRSRPPYTHYVSTRWYRAPEVLLRLDNYNSPIDVWACGAIMAELYTFRPLFPGANEKDQMYKICSVRGAPTHKSWAKGLMLAHSMNFEFPLFKATPLQKLVPNACPEAINLMEALLAYDPDRRPNANQALTTSYFKLFNPSSSNAGARSNKERSRANRGEKQSSKTSNAELAASANGSYGASSAAPSRAPNAPQKAHPPSYARGSRSDKPKPVPPSEPSSSMNGGARGAGAQPHRRIRDPHPPSGAGSSSTYKGRRQGGRRGNSHAVAGAAVTGAKKSSSSSQHSGLLPNLVGSNGDSKSTKPERQINGHLGISPASHRRSSGRDHNKSNGAGGGASHLSPDSERQRRLHKRERERERQLAASKAALGGGGGGGGGGSGRSRDARAPELPFLSPSTRKTHYGKPKHVGSSGLRASGRRALDGSDRDKDLDTHHSTSPIGMMRLRRLRATNATQNSSERSAGGGRNRTVSDSAARGSGRREDNTLPRLNGTEPALQISEAAARALDLLDKSAPPGLGIRGDGQGGGGGRSYRGRRSDRRTDGESGGGSSRRRRHGGDRGNPSSHYSIASQVLDAAHSGGGVGIRRRNNNGDAPRHRDKGKPESSLRQIDLGGGSRTKASYKSGRSPGLNDLDNQLFSGLQGSSNQFSGSAAAASRQKTRRRGKDPLGIGGHSNRHSQRKRW